MKVKLYVVCTTSMNFYNKDPFHGGSRNVYYTCVINISLLLSCTWTIAIRQSQISEANFIAVLRNLPYAILCKSQYFTSSKTLK